MSRYTAEQIIAEVASLATAVAFQSGTASMELAGQIVSRLAKDPSLIDQFMVDGSEMFLNGEFNADLGTLSWYGSNGQIVTPERMKAILTANALRKSVGADKRK